MASGTYPCSRTRRGTPAPLTTTLSAVETSGRRTQLRLRTSHCHTCVHRAVLEPRQPCSGPAHPRLHAPNVFHRLHFCQRSVRIAVNDTLCMLSSGTALRSPRGAKGPCHPRHQSRGMRSRAVLAAPSWQRRRARAKRTGFANIEMRSIDNCGLSAAHCIAAQPGQHRLRGVERGPDRRCREEVDVRAHAPRPVAPLHLAPLRRCRRAAAAAPRLARRRRRGNRRWHDAALQSTFGPQ